MINGTNHRPSDDISDHHLIVSKSLVIGGEISHHSQSIRLKLRCCLREAEGIASRKLPESMLVFGKKKNLPNVRLLGVGGFQ